jgi:hypothetical protein
MIKIAWLWLQIFKTFLIFFFNKLIASLKFAEGSIIIV